MGTRARVNVYEGDKILVSIYRQFDGYPTGLGQELANFSKEFQIVNGIPLGKEQETKIANGMGCFAAQLIACLKGAVGNVYIRPTSKESHGEEFEYDLHDNNGQIFMVVLNGCGTMFGNPGDEADAMNLLWAGLASEYDGAKVDEEEEENIDG